MIRCIKFTNAKVDRKDVLSTQEIEAMFKKADQLKHEYFRLRAKALVSIFRTGKRRAEVATLEKTDIKTREGFLEITFTVVKKRKKKVLSTRRTKKFRLSSQYAKHILAYLAYLKRRYPKCKFLFPRLQSVFGQAFFLYEDKHLSGRQILRIIKQLDPNAWCHLFRETRGAEIVKGDERKGRLSIFTAYRVKHALDLERETTAWNYMSRYAEEVIETEEEQEID